MTFVGCRVSHEGVLQTSAPPMSHPELGKGSPGPNMCPVDDRFTIGRHLIISITQPLWRWLRGLPACHSGEVGQSARVNTLSHRNQLEIVSASASTFSTFYLFISNLFDCTVLALSNRPRSHTALSLSLSWWNRGTKMVIVGARLVPSQARFLHAMTLYCTIIILYFSQQLKK